MDNNLPPDSDSNCEVLDIKADISKVITCPPPPFDFSNNKPVIVDRMSVLPALIVSLLLL